MAQHRKVIRQNLVNPNNLKDIQGTKILRNITNIRVIKNRNLN